MFSHKHQKRSVCVWYGTSRPKRIANVIDLSRAFQCLSPMFVIQSFFHSFFIYKPLLETNAAQAVGLIGENILLGITRLDSVSVLCHGSKMQCSEKLWKKHFFLACLLRSPFSNFGKTPLRRRRETKKTNCRHSQTLVTTKNILPCSYFYGVFISVAWYLALSFALGLHL